MWVIYKKLVFGLACRVSIVVFFMSLWSAKGSIVSGQNPKKAHRAPPGAEDPPLAPHRIQRPQPGQGPDHKRGRESRQIHDPAFAELEAALLR